MEIAVFKLFTGNYRQVAAEKPTEKRQKRQKSNSNRILTFCSFFKIRNYGNPNFFNLQENTVLPCFPCFRVVCRLRSRI